MFLGGGPSGVELEAVADPEVLCHLCSGLVDLLGDSGLQLGVFFSGSFQIGAQLGRGAFGSGLGDLRRFSLRWTVVRTTRRWPR